MRVASVQQTACLVTFNVYYADTVKGFALVHQLRRIAQDFLLGYMHKMELDVSQVLRSVARPRSQNGLCVTMHLCNSIGHDTGKQAVTTS